MAMASHSPVQFNSSEIHARLQEKGVHWISEIQYFDSIDSSNSYLMSLASAHGKVCIADFQTQGRGRRGKQWHSPAGQSIMFSLGWAPTVAIQGEISLVVGVALADVLADLGVEGLELKWPNDVQVAGAKLAGILIESRIKGQRVEVVMGIGLNVDHDKAGLDKIETDWTDIKSLGLKAISREALLVLILTGIAQRLAQFEQHGFAQIRKDWLAYHADQGREVSFSHKGQQRTGIISGLDARGALLIECDGENIAVNSGEVHSIRGKVQ